MDPGRIQKAERREGLPCLLSALPVVSSTYWNHVYGKEPKQVQEDKEGLMTMYNIGKNMAWMLKCIELGKKNGLEHPVNEKILTNFTR